VPVGTPIRVATNSPSYSAAPVSSDQPLTLYAPAGANPIPPNVQPGVAPEPPQGMAHMGRSEPAYKIIPFFLNPAEQQELDAFLARWEKYSADIRRYDVDFNMHLYDPTIPGAEPNKANKVTFGYFKYNANPMRFAYVIEGEWQGNKKIKREGDKNPNIFAEKVIIDEKSVHQYDYNSKTVRQINVPPEMIGKGIADSPLPMIFGAKADELKRRFSMKIVSVPGREDSVWLHARPLLIEDQQEFKQLEILIDKRTLHARGLRQWDINDKSYKVYELMLPVINPKIGPILEEIKTLFTPTIERGWKHEVVNWVVPASPSPAVPSPAAAMPQAQIADPQSQPYRNEVPLYHRGQ
jgi:TIGR03009 family protein